MQRRCFLKQTLLTTLGISAGQGLPFPSVFAEVPVAQDLPKRKVLLRSSWQTVNIGDIAHTPGLLRLLEQHLPEIEITLWPRRLDNGVGLMLRKAFPDINIVEGTLHRKTGAPSNNALAAALAETDFFLHGSGPSVVAYRDLLSWKKTSDTPYGIYGVSLSEIDDTLHELLSEAEFVFCRDSISLELAKSEDCTPKVLEFAPDATFGVDLRNDELAETYLKNQGLKPGEFLCVIPRLRYTPYYKVHHTEPSERDLERDAYNAEHVEEDHAKLRAVMIAWVRETGLKVLACPEMTYQVDLAKEVLVDPLPDDVKEKVVWRDSYWLPDEAASVYARAAGLVSFEMHSPILSVAAGTPAIYLQQPTDSTKGEMWVDIGLDDWKFEIEDATAEEITAAALLFHTDREATSAKLAQAMTVVHRRQRESLGVLAEML